MSQSVSGDPLNLDAIEQSDLVLVCNMIPALVAEVRALRASLAEQDDNTPSAQRSADYWLRQTQRAEAERDHARAEWHRHNERADAFRAELSELRGKIAAVEALHQRNENGIGPDDCGTCSEAAQAWVRWPCPTARVLSGSQEPGGDR